MESPFLTAATAEFSLKKRSPRNPELRESPPLLKKS